MKANFSHKLTYALLRMLVGGLSRLPFRLLYCIADVLYILAYDVVRYRRKVVRANLVSSFPEKSLKEIMRIERRFYRFLADMIFETVKLYSISTEEIQRRCVFKNMDNVHRQLLDGKSISVYIGHFCNWEWISSFGLWVPPEEAKVVQIYHRLDNEYVGRIVERMRTRFNDVSVEMRETVKYMAMAKHDGEQMMIGFIADQSPAHHECKYFVPFLNHETPAHTGTEKLTKHFGFNAWFMSGRRVKRGYYEFTFEPMCDNPRDVPDYELTDMYYRCLEKEIREQPEYYLWSHRRFKFARPL